MKHKQQQLDSLAFEFFKLFAQYESTLKERHFFQANGGRIQVDWDRFANEVAGRDFRKKLLDAKIDVEYILDRPPMKQGVNEAGKIIWVEVSNKDKSVQALFGHICRIRNNLFHGAKFNGTWFDPERSEELLVRALQVLEYYRP